MVRRLFGSGAQSAVIAVALGLIISLGPMLLPATGASDAQPGWEQEAKVVPDGTASFGKAVALDGDRALVGAIGEGSGAAYVFQETTDGWVQEARLTPDDAGPAEQFGGSVALAGDTALVGDTQVPPGGNPDSTAGPGAVYAFDLTESGDWIQVAKLTAPSPQDGAQFGVSIALDGDTAIVGASGQDTAAGQDAGAAFVFTTSGTGQWSLQEALETADANAADEFGSSVALDADTALVGAWLADTSTADTGAAYTYSRTAGTWSQAAKLEASDASPGDLFGDDVAVEDGQGIVGASGAGVAYAYDAVTSSGTETQALEGDGLLAGLDAVALSGSTAVIGDVGMGMAYVFVKDQGDWSQIDALDAPDAVQDQYGWAVAFDGTAIAVGAPLHDSSAGRDAGALYLYDTCTESGPASSLIHGNVEPAIEGSTDGPVHALNCDLVRYLESTG